MKHRIAAASTVALAMAGQGAHAQSLDYAALQALFGEPVTTSVTGSPQRAGEVPADMEIITQDDIRRSGADNIPDILRFVTGLDVRTYGIATAEVAVHGYSQTPNPRLLVMINGRQAYIDDYGYAAWSALPVQLDEIRQIEVVKGPNSALFGFNAVSGVINIITFNALKDGVNAIAVRTGTQHLAEGSAVATLKLGETAGVRLSMGGFKAHDFAPVGLSPSDIAMRKSPERGALNLEVAWQIAPAVVLNAEASVVSSETNMRFGGFFFDVTFRTNSLRAGAAADTDLGFITVDAYRNEIRLNYLSTLTGPDPEYNVVYVAKASDILKVGANHVVRFGVEYRSNAVTGADYSGRIGYHVYSADAMWNWQVARALTLSNAVRIDHLNLNYSGTLVPGTGYTLAQYNAAAMSPITFNSGVVWTVTGADTLRLIAARGVQAPSADEFGVQSPIDGAPPFLGDPNIKPAFVWNLAFGYERRLDVVNGSIRATAFLQRNDNLLGESFFSNPMVLPNGTLAIKASNIGSSRQAGIDLEAKGATSFGLRWNASYSFAKITDRINPAQAIPAFDYAHASPQHAVIAGIGYSIGKWELDAHGRWQSAFHDYSIDTDTLIAISVPVHAYVSADARVGYQVTDFLTVALSGQHLTERRQLQTAGPITERRLIVSARASF
jgi:iron complex outermembrane receptor protein